jgi:NADH:ubiquinone oxidoreductase subunit 5 (subunit L)/multisubunit Na+/H+ antiporter MnhA subunit
MSGPFTAAFQRVQEIHLLWLIPLFPFLGAVINGILGKTIQDKLGKKAVHTIAIGAMLAAAAVACYVFFAKLVPAPAGARTFRDFVFPMIQLGAIQVDFALTMDQLSGTMTLIITLIGTGIHVYSVGYMHDEKAYWRFFCYLNLFVFSMLLLVLGDSFLLMFFGWEGVGLCSYLLIGFWYTDFAKATAGMKAFVVNRVGDFGFVTGLFLLFWGLNGTWKDGTYLQFDRTTHQVMRVDPGHHGAGEAPFPDGEMTEVNIGPTMSFQELRQQLALTDAEGKRPIASSLATREVWGIPLIFLICLCFFIGATGKSAQIPLYVWLPDAMAGPTPVSALIHAATMVTAGVYMVARLNFLFWLSPSAMSVVATVGALTALFAATMGLFQYDIKKVLAYSTVSQLGFMFLGVGVGAWWAGVFHLLTHACFKACLFLGSGSVIHGMHFVAHHHDDHGHGHHEPPKPRDSRLEPDPHDPQDMRNMGGLAELMPWTRWTYLIACVSIAGFPLAAGFYSKDEILWKAMSNGATLVPGWLLWGMGFLAACCTSFYMFRSYYMTFHFRAPTEDMKHHVHESPVSITGILAVLAFLAIFTGFLGLPHLWTHSEPLFEAWLAPVMSLSPFRQGIHSHALELALMAASVFGAALGGWQVARFFYLNGAHTAQRMESLKTHYAGVHRLLYNKYWVDEIYQATFVRGFMGLSRGFAWIDRNCVDWLVNATSYVARGAAWLSGWIDNTFVDGAVNGVARVIMRLGKEGRRVQTGRINNYVFGVVVGVLALFLITSLSK